MSGDDDYYAYPKDDIGGVLDFNGYQPNTTDPGLLLFLVTTSTVVLLMAIFVPCMVVRRKISRKRQKASQLDRATVVNRCEDASVTENDEGKRTSTEDSKADDNLYVQLEEQPASPDAPKSKSDRTTWENLRRKFISSIKSIVQLDKESRSILRYAGPFTFYAIAASVLSNVILALISWYIGTKEVVAYAVVSILVSLSEDFLKGPLYANTNLIARAIAVNNHFLAGQYVQLSLWLYLMVGGPFLVFWYCFTYEIVLFLTTGDEKVAGFAQGFVKIYIWSYVTDSIHQAIGQLLDVTGHEIFTTSIDFSKSMTNVLTMVYWIESNTNINLNSIAWMYLGSSFFYLVVSSTVAVTMGWLKPFMKGMVKNPAIMNEMAIQNLLKTTIPLAFGSVVSNAEWAVLTILAGYLGPAEVSAWAILATIWMFFGSLTKGIGDAAETRIAYHLGNNHPSLAKLSAYKSLYLGMFGSSMVSIVFFAIIDRIPSWFTPDATLQGMIGSTLPYIGVGNIALTFGYLCWYLVGAQGRYKLGTLMNFFANWCVTMPLAATFTFAWNFDLQGLTSAVVLGYVGLGASLSYILLTSDWDARAAKVQKRKLAAALADTRDGVTTSPEEDEEANEELYAVLAGGRSRAARATTKRNIRLFTAPPGMLGIQIGTLSHRSGVMVTKVMPTSPFFGRVFVGDIILSVDGYIVAKNSPASSVHDIVMLRQDTDRELTILTTPGHCRYEDSNHVLLVGETPDIDDFESFDLGGLLS